jgi:hypothetical protein
MPVLSTVGAASLRAFGAFRAGGLSPFIVATGGTVYVDPTDANYKIHEFTSSSSFFISSCPASATLEAFLVGGGGAGLYGGGGAGGMVYEASHPVSVGTYGVTIGSGGTSGASGGDTIFSSLTALGGGSRNTAGGSGGGGVDNNGGAGLQPTSSTGGYGNAGGNWTSFGNDGGGGGAANAGSVPAGGDGRNAFIRNSSGVFDPFAKGGYGNLNSTSYQSPSVVANSGNGGWGGGYNGVSFGSGQAGIVRIRYKFQ